MDIKKIIFNLPNHFRAFVWRIRTLYFRFFLGKIGKNSILCGEIKLKNPEAIFIEDNVVVNPYAWIYCVNEKESIVRIKKGTQIGHRFHCVSEKGVGIGEDVLIADNVFISDCNHGIEVEHSLSFLEQKTTSKRNIEIGNGTWIGENVAIIGANIGKKCVIGANAVVTHDVDDYCIVAGNPAKVIKRYNFSTHKWERIINEA